MVINETILAKVRPFIEEISTTHVLGDSYYEEEAIGRIDAMKRKTVLTGW